jgi:hypothetical protein
MQPLLPEKESGNGTGATGLVQAKYRALSIPLSDGFRYPSFFDWYGSSVGLVQSVVFTATIPVPAPSARRSRAIGKAQAAQAVAGFQ